VELRSTSARSVPSEQHSGLIVNVELEPIFVLYTNVFDYGVKVTHNWPQLQQF